MVYKVKEWIGEIVAISKVYDVKVNDLASVIKLSAAVQIHLVKRRATDIWQGCGQLWACQRQGGSDQPPKTGKTENLGTKSPKGEKAKKSPSGLIAISRPWGNSWGKHRTPFGAEPNKPLEKVNLFEELWAVILWAATGFIVGLTSLYKEKGVITNGEEGDGKGTGGGISSMEISMRERPPLPNSKPYLEIFPPSNSEPPIKVISSPETDLNNIPTAQWENYDPYPYVIVGVIILGLVLGLAILYYRSSDIPALPDAPTETLRLPTPSYFDSPAAPLQEEITEAGERIFELDMSERLERLRPEGFCNYDSTPMIIVSECPERLPYNYEAWWTVCYEVSMITQYQSPETVIRWLSTRLPDVDAHEDVIPVREAFSSIFDNTDWFPDNVVDLSVYELNMMAHYWVPYSQVVYPTRARIIFIQDKSHFHFVSTEAR